MKLKIIAGVEIYYCARYFIKLLLRVNFYKTQGEN